MSAKAVSRLKRSISHSDLEMSEFISLQEYLEERAKQIMWERLKKARRLHKPLYIHNVKHAKDRTIAKHLIGLAIYVERVHLRKFKKGDEKAREYRQVSLRGGLIDGRTIAVGFAAMLDLQFEPCPEGLAYLLTGKDDE